MFFWQLSSDISVFSGAQHTLGLFELHQLRGRVGRASCQAHAYLMHPKQMDDEPLQRLHIMEQESALGAGFAIAHRQLKQCGHGDHFGVAQKGASVKVSNQVSQYREVVKRVAAASDPNAAAISFATEANAIGVTAAALHWEAPVAQCKRPHADAPTAGVEGLVEGRPDGGGEAAEESSRIAEPVDHCSAHRDACVPFPTPSGPVPRVRGGSDDGKPCWWDGSAGCWRRPNGNKTAAIVWNSQTSYACSSPMEFAELLSSWPHVAALCQGTATLGEFRKFLRQSATATMSERRCKHADVPALCNALERNLTIADRTSSGRKPWLLDHFEIWNQEMREFFEGCLGMLEDPWRDKSEIGCTKLWRGLVELVNVVERSNQKAGSLAARCKSSTPFSPWPLPHLEGITKPLWLVDDSPSEEEYDPRSLMCHYEIATKRHGHLAMVRAH